ncbi:MAG: zinc ribbon domain-containing protein [Candidatus Marinimicrobia bacterium]|nr:zinc ribbon domain-containing protein [Candidatus Neomarinimicrobiota bacterium]
MIRHQGRLLKGLHTAIITPEQYNKAQIIVSENAQKKNLGRSRMNRPLNGLVFCGLCEGYFKYQSGTGKSKKRYDYYRCTHSIGKNATCNNLPIPSRHLEDMVIGAIQSLVSDKEYTGRIVREATQVDQSEVNNIKTELSAVRQTINSVETKQKNTVMLFTGDEARIKITNEILHELEEELTQLRSSEVILIERLEKLQQKVPNTEALVRTLSKFTGLVDQLDPESKMKLFHLFISGIKVSMPKDDQGHSTVEINLYAEPPSKIESIIDEGSHVYNLLLRRRDLNSRPGG